MFGIVNNRDNTRTQTFTYDTLNRLITAQNAGTDCTQTTATGGSEYWGNSYAYDAWGNLLEKQITKCSAETLSVSADNNNRIHTGAAPDYAYDAAGNMTYDATSGNTYTYDPENRITGAGGFTYTYDADGNRVEKSMGGAGTIYWYMTPGIVAESDLSGNLKSEYVFFAGHRVARRDFPGDAVSYYFADHLQTASVITNSSGTMTEDEDYYPWGGEIQFVNSDSNHYKFTGKERDAESGLDYIGARYYGNWYGRFATPDPLHIKLSRLTDPQQLNLYSYVRNIPTGLADPSGLDITVQGDASDKYLKALQSDVGYKIGLDDKGKVQVTTSKEDLGKMKLTKQEKAILKAINDPKHHVTINAISKGNSGVFFGRSDAPHTGAHTIAFDQVGLLDASKNAGGMTSGQLVGHETMEGYYESTGLSMNDAHDAANDSFGGLEKGRVTGLFVRDNTAFGFRQQFQIHGSNAVENIDMKWDSPVPRQSVHSGMEAPAVPVNVEKAP